MPGNRWGAFGNHLALILVPGATIALWCARLLLADGTGETPEFRPGQPVRNIPIAVTRLEPGMIVRNADLAWRGPPAPVVSGPLSHGPSSGSCGCGRTVSVEDFVKYVDERGKCESGPRDLDE